jgi:hypothetical protein
VSKPQRTEGRFKLEEIDAATPNESQTVTASEASLDHSDDIVRPTSGTELLNHQTASGRGSFTIFNGTSRDAVVVLLESEVQRRAIYIRANDQATLAKVASGTYEAIFMSGDSWDGTTFRKGAIFEKFEDVADFREARDGDRITYSTFEVTLHSTVDGNAKTESIPPFQLVADVHLERTP